MAKIRLDKVGSYTLITLISGVIVSATYGILVNWEKISGAIMPVLLTGIRAFVPFFLSPF